MKILRLLLLFALGGSAYATTYTEFYCRTGGNNLNAGSTTNVAAITTHAAGTWDGTSVFTTGGGENPVADNIDLDATWASVYTTSGATTNQYTALITATNDTTITLSTTHFGGAAATPSTSAGATTLKIGGAWAGPNAAVQFPFGYPAKATMTDDSSNPPRFNIMAVDGAYSITAGLVENAVGPYTFQGCDYTAGDGTRATINGPAVATSFILLTASSGNVDYVDLIFGVNGNSGSASGLSVASGGVENTFKRVVVHDVFRSGFNATAPSLFIECEAYNCNQNNSSGHAGFISGASTYIRCISHDNSAGNNCSGFIASGSAATFINCVADTNAKDGVTASTTVGAFFYGCDFYNNTGSGIDFSGASAAQVIIENCNFVKNTGYGISSSGSSVRNGVIHNCGFPAAGTTANGTDIATALASVFVTGSVTYAADSTPWNTPTSGNFSITLAAAKNAGRGTFTQTQGSYGTTLAYPDIGAAQHQTPAATGTARAIPFVQ